MAEKCWCGQPAGKYWIAHPGEGSTLHLCDSHAEPYLDLEGADEAVAALFSWLGLEVGEMPDCVKCGVTLEAGSDVCPGCGKGALDREVEHIENIERELHPDGNTFTVAAENMALAAGLRDLLKSKGVKMVQKGAIMTFSKDGNPLFELDTRMYSPAGWAHAARDQLDNISTPGTFGTYHDQVKTSILAELESGPKLYEQLRKGMHIARFEEALKVLETAKLIEKRGSYYQLTRWDAPRMGAREGTIVRLEPVHKAVLARHVQDAKAGNVSHVIDAAMARVGRWDELVAWLKSRLPSGWEAIPDHSIGSLFFSNIKYAVYATPYYEMDHIPIEVQDEDGQQLLFETIAIEPRITFEDYLEKMMPILRVLSGNLSSAQYEQLRRLPFWGYEKDDVVQISNEEGLYGDNGQPINGKWGKVLQLKLERRPANSVVREPYNVQIAIIKLDDGQLVQMPVALLTAYSTTNPVKTLKKLGVL